MSKVTCRVCGKSMSVINNKHLASHALTTAQYREQFPDAPMMTQAVADKMSARAVASNAPRKGVARTAAARQSMREGQARYHATHESQPRGPMSDAQKQTLKELALERYANGFVHPNQGKHLPEAVRLQIAETLSGRVVGPETANQAIATKRRLGYDMAPFRNHRHTKAAKDKIGAAGRARRDDNRLVIRRVMQERINEANLTLLNSITADVFQLRCNVCAYVFTRNSPIFQPSKFHLQICDQCFPKSPVSDQENEVAAFIQQLSDTKMIRSDAEVLANLELDIYLPEKQIAIEYCGLYWHSEMCNKRRFYHRFKHDECQRQGIRLITIFEDEWVNSRPIVESMLRNALSCPIKTLNARSCKVREIDSDDAIAFLQANHLQGRGRSKLKFGLLHDDELVAVMSFMDSEISHRSVGWEINRFCSKIGYSIRGGASKLFSAFIRQYQPAKVTSYADLRWGLGGVYGQIGFQHVGNTVPNYWYLRANEVKRYHRYVLRKTPADPVDVPERLLRESEGWYRIWDCGHAKWVYDTNAKVPEKS